MTMDGTGALDRARDAYARRAWLDAHEAFSRADGDAVNGFQMIENLGNGSFSKRTLVSMYDEAFVARLATDNRYVLDVWASN